MYKSPLYTVNLQDPERLQRRKDHHHRRHHRLPPLDAYVKTSLQMTNLLMQWVFFLGIGILIRTTFPYSCEQSFEQGTVSEIETT